ncbi:unnamed protein product [Cuscuta campestris]|uniref:CCHC-type domain-containing protein n=1 Tax=Cuscuta campestris TaxID=132261 RepID=A0A484LD42_9ASTE|nr:unnamed protein product [Cuscuta campestris]
MAPVDPATWTHESSIIKEDELREVAELLGRGFRVQHPNAVGGINLSHNPNPQKYMVMHYHSVENGFKLPLHDLVRDICHHFEFVPGQLTANAHKYAASYILRCCALDRTPTLDEFLVLFSIGGPFSYYSLFPHPQSPIFERVELKIDKWARRYFVIELPVHSPIDFPGTVRCSSISRTPFAAIPQAEAAYNILREERGVSSPERSKTPPVVESNLAGSSSGSQAQGNTTALAVCKPPAALDVIPISGIPGLRKPTPSRKRLREGVTGDDFLPKKNKSLELPNPDSLDREGDELPDQSALKRPALQPQPEANLEKMRESVQEPAIPQARPDLLALNALHFMEQAQQSLLTLTEEYLGGASGNYRTVVVLKEKELAVRALQQKVDTLEQQVQVLQEENARIKANGSMELAAERSRVKSLQEQIAIYQSVETRDCHVFRTKAVFVLMTVYSTSTLKESLVLECLSVVYTLREACFPWLYEGKKVGDKLIPKTEDEFDAEDIKKVENYAKAINMLYRAVNPDDYRKISCCTTAKEMWDKLEVAYEGTNQVREAKIDFLTQEYEMFRMKPGEKIDDMFNRLSKIINDLHALKKTYAKKDFVRKILWSLTPEWRSKADAIYESIGVSNVTIDGLRGNLKTYESTILTPSLDEQKNKGIALKATKEMVEDESSDEDNKFDLIIKKFHKFMKKEHERKGKKHDNSLKCYGCGKIGHIKPRCPKAKNAKDKHGFKKQRAYISWGGDSDDESSEQEEDEEANLCLIAQEEEESSNDRNQEVCISSTDSYSLEEMQEALQELYDEFVSASKTNKALKKRLPIRGDDIATYGADDWILNNEAVVIRELGIINLIRHSGAPTIHSAPPDKHLLLYIITLILRPRDNSHTSLFNEDLKAIHAIIHSASINWAKFVMIHMADYASIATERSLPYAFLVMDLIISADISISGPNTKMTKIWIIQDSTFRKKSGDRDDAGPSRARAPARALAPAPARASLQFIADTLNRLTLTVDDMGQYMEQMDWTLQRQHHDMTAFFRGINYVPPPFDTTFLGQNYEGEDKEDNTYAPSSSPDEADFEDAVDGDPMDVEDDEEDDDTENEDADA